MPGDSERILLVEDDPDLSDLLAALLERAGYTVKVAHDGLVALEMVEEFAPELAVIDIGLPHLDGLQLAALLRERHPAVVLVCLTGLNDVDTRRQAHAAGFALHIAKPVNPPTLLPVLRAALVRARQARQP